MFPRNENRNEGTFAKPPFYETALLSPSDWFAAALVQKCILCIAAFGCQYFYADRPGFVS